jgi:hypothetical protein
VAHFARAIHKVELHSSVRLGSFSVLQIVTLVPTDDFVRDLIYEERRDSRKDQFYHREVLCE